MEQEWVSRRVPGAPVVRFSRRVMQGIATEIREAAAGNREAGGILVGVRGSDEIVIEDFEPVPSEHRFGPSYRLSEEDLRGLVETLEWFGPRVLGFYCSHLGDGFAFDARKRDLLEEHFRDSQSLFLLLKPLRAGILGDFFVRRQGGIRQADQVAAFPFEHRAEPPAPPRPELPPRPKTVARPRRSYRPVWAGAALLAVTALAGVLGYRSVRPAPPAPEPRRPAPAVAAPLPPPPQAGEAARSAPEPEPILSDNEQIRALLERWTDAQRKGNRNALAECYTPQARGAALRNTGRFGILRLEDLQITPLGPARAAAVFRKHWQTGGARPFAGEQQERLTLVKRDAGWKIDSAEQLKVYWTSRP